MTYVLRCCASENGLVRDGPLVEARLSPPRIQAEHLAGQGKKIPSVATKLMIDTGAAKTAIDTTLSRRRRDLRELAARVHVCCGSAGIHGRG